MKKDQYRELKPNVRGNAELRDPQREGFEAIATHFAADEAEREIALVLPVGCGKSGLIAISPFAVHAKRALVVAPGVRIADQLYQDADPANPRMFCKITMVLGANGFPEPAEIRGKETNFTDLEAADVVITNIQQLQGEENRWLAKLPADFFDVLVDEGHHNVATSWELLRGRFPDAKIINFSATPTRADGQLMAGQIIYSYPIFRAIEKGYVKRLRAVVLNPARLRYVRREDEREIEVDLDEVRRLGESESDFRRSIVSSKETLRTIVDASINEMRKLRERTGDQRHKIIASALNQQHCIQIVQAYRERGLRAEYVHTNEDSAKNAQTLRRLENHELDVIVQVRKLGEGFDHRYLSVAAVCSIFSNLGPFVQFVGRIMRAIEPNKPESSLNQGVVVFHAGSNVAQRWTDFQQFSEADRAYFDQLLPMEGLDFTRAEEILIEPELPAVVTRPIDIRGQENITLQEIPLLKDDPKAREAVEYLVSRGFTPGDYAKATEHAAVPVTKQRQRQAARQALDERIKNAAGRVLKERNMNPMGRELDKQHLGRENLIVVKAEIDKRCNALVGKGQNQRDEFTQADCDKIDEALDSIIAAVTAEIVDGKT